LVLRIHKSGSAGAAESKQSVSWIDAIIEVSHFCIPPALMAKTASDAFDRDAQSVELHDLLRAEDPILTWIGDQMVQEVAAGGLGGRLCYDALALQGCVHIHTPRCSLNCPVHRDVSGLPTHG
jgi:hypothetical protein